MSRVLGSGEFQGPGTTGTRRPSSTTLSSPDRYYPGHRMLECDPSRRWARFEPECNRIYLNEQIFAELSMSRPDRRWHLIYVWGCRQSLLH